MDPEIKDKLTDLESKMNDIDLKLCTILELLQTDIRPNCNKMSSHIDFVDNIYENVKHPLGFICSRVGMLAGDDTYSLQNSNDDDTHLLK